MTMAPTSATPGLGVGRPVPVDVLRREDSATITLLARATRVRGDLAGGDVSPGHEPADRAVAVVGQAADEVQPGNRRFQPTVEHRVAVALADAAAKRRLDERQLLHARFVAGGEDHVVDLAAGAVAQLETDPARFR